MEREERKTKKLKEVEEQQQVIFEYRVSGFYTDVISTNEKENLKEIRSNSSFSLSSSLSSSSSSWSIGNLFSFQNNDQNIRKERENQNPLLPWQVSLDPTGEIVAYLQTGVLSTYDYLSGAQQFYELPSSFCKNPDKRKIKWSPCSSYLIILSSDSSLLIFSKECHVVGLISPSSLSKVTHEIFDFFPFETSRKKSNSHFELYLHLVAMNGDCHTIHLSAHQLQEPFSIHIAVLCTLTNQLRKQTQVEAACYLPQHQAIILLNRVQNNLSFSDSQYQTQITYLQYKEAQSTSQSLALVSNFYSQPLLNQAPPHDGSKLFSSPFRQICYDPTEKHIILLHSSGRITFFLLNADYSMPQVISISELEEISQKAPISNFHFLSDSSFVVLTTLGETFIYSLQWSHATHSLDQNRHFSLSFDLMSVESLPPILGKSTSSSRNFPQIAQSNSDLHSEVYSRISILRCVDPWTCQLFTMTSVSPFHAIQTKIKEGFFSSAYDLAERIGVNSDTITLAEWKYHHQQIERLFANGIIHSLSESGNSNIVTTYLNKINSLDILVAEILSFSSTSLDLWMEVLNEGLRRTQNQADIVFKGVKKLEETLYSSNLSELVKEELERTENADDFPNLLASISYRKQIMNRTLKLLAYRILVENEINFNELIEYSSAEYLPPQIQENLNLQNKDLEVVLFLPFRTIAVYLLRCCYFEAFKQIYSLCPQQTFPSFLQLLSYIPLSCDPSKYHTLLPIPFEDYSEIMKTKEFGDVLGRVYTYDEQNPSHPFILLAPSTHFQLVSFVASTLESKDITQYLKKNSLELIHLPEDYFIGIDQIVDWSVKRIWRIESLGQSSLSLQFLVNLLKIFDGPCTRQHPKRAHLKELYVQLKYFTSILYHHLCPLSLSFLEWSTSPTSSRLRMLFDECSQLQLQSNQSNLPSLDFVDIFNLYVTPMFLSPDEKLFSSLSCSDYMNLIFQNEFSFNDFQQVPSLLSIDSRRINTLVQQIEVRNIDEMIVRELVSTVLVSSHEKRDISMENICRIVENSKSTLPTHQRCLKSLPTMVDLVICTCRSYNFMNKVSLEYMWRLIESTPSGVTDLILRQQQEELDSIQCSLSVGEILRSYFPEEMIPTINSLIPRTSQHRHEHRKYCSLLLKGVSGYGSGLIHLLNPGNGSQKVVFEDEGLTQLYQLGHAIILSVCSIALERFREIESENILLAACSDCKELRRLLFQDIPSSWIESVYLQVLLSEKKALYLFLDIANSIISPSISSTHNFGLDPTGVYYLLYSHITGVINSVTSCFSEDLSELSQLFQDLLTPDTIAHCNDQTLSQKIQFETNLLKVIEYIKSFQNSRIDFIPLQLRFRTSLEIVRFILSVEPNCYTYNQNGSLSGGSQYDPRYFQSIAQTSGAGKESDPENNIEEDSLTRHYLLKHKEIPGKYFIKTFYLLSSLPSIGGEICLYHEVVTAAIAAGYLIDALELCDDLVHRKDLQNLPLVSQDTPVIADVVLVVLNAIDAIVPHTDSTDLRDGIRLFKERLCRSFVESCPDIEISSACHLLQANNGSLFQISVEKRNQSDDIFLESAKSLLWQIVGDILYRPCSVQTLSDPICSVSEIIGSASASGALSVAIGYLSMIEEKSLVIQLFHSILKELKSKISKSYKSSYKRQGGENVVPQESLVTQIEAKGFHRNSAIRAAIACKNHSLEAALKWTIDHFNDPDFVEPVALNQGLVSGALLKCEPPAITLTDLNRAVEVVSKLALFFEQEPKLVEVSTESIDTISSSESKTSLDNKMTELKSEFPDPDDKHILVEHLAITQPQLEMETEFALDSLNSGDSSLLIPSAQTSTEIEPAPIHEISPLMPKVIAPQPSASTVVLAQITKATTAISTLTELIGIGEGIVHCGVDCAELSRSIIFWEENLPENDSDNVYGELIPLLTELAKHRNEDSFVVLNNIIQAIPQGFLTLLYHNIENLHFSTVSRLPLLQNRFDEENSLEYLQSTYSKEMNIPELLMGVFAEIRLISVLCMIDAPLSDQLDYKDEIPTQFTSYLQKTPQRFFCLLRSAYQQTEGGNCDKLFQIKRITLEFFSSTSIVDLNRDSTILSNIKSILQEDLATIKRIKRMQGISSHVNMKKILQSDELLPGTFFQEGSISGLRETALQEVAKHITVDNISQWNRSVGRLLETGLSELGLHFGLLRSTQLSKVLQESPESQEDNIFHTKEYVKSLGYIVSKLRYEHFSVLLMTLSSLQSHSDYFAQFEMSLNLYSIDLPPFYLDLILKGFHAYITSNGEVVSLSESKKKTSTKGKPLIKKLSETGELSSIQGEAEANFPERSPTFDLLDLLSNFNQLFLFLPFDQYLLIRKTYNCLDSLLELISKAVVSPHYSMELLAKILEVAKVHTTRKFHVDISVQEILNLTTNRLLCLNSFTKSYRMSDWNLVILKFETLLAEVNSNEVTHFWSQFIQTSLQISDLDGYPFQSRFEMIQALDEKGKLTDLTCSQSSQQLKLFFHTHILFTSTPILFETYQTDLPLSIKCFSSMYTLSELFHHLIGRLGQGNTVENMKKIVPYFVHLLRLWGWGSGRLEKNEEKIALLLSYWTHRGNTKTINSDLEQQDEQISVELPCWMVILCLSSQNCDIAIFFDVFVLDILLTVQSKKIQSRIASYQSLILEYSNHFPQDVAAWIRIYLLNSLDSESIQTEVDSYLSLLQTKDSFDLSLSAHIFLLLILQIPVAQYVKNEKILSLVLDYSFDWLDRRLESRLNSVINEESREFCSPENILLSFILQLSSKNSIVLPRVLSPVAIVQSLLSSKYLIEASMISWKLLQLPQTAFRNDTAYLMLLRHFQTVSGDNLPFYFQCLPEIASHEWGWE